MTGETVYVLEFLTPYEPGDFEGVFSTPERAKSHARAFNDALEWVDTGTRALSGPMPGPPSGSSAQ